MISYKKYLKKQGKNYMHLVIDVMIDDMMQDIIVECQLKKNMYHKSG